MGTFPSPAADQPAAPVSGDAAATPRARLVIGALAALVLAWLAWQGYRNPDLLLGLAAFRLC